MLLAGGPKALQPYLENIGYLSRLGPGYEVNTIVKWLLLLLSTVLSVCVALLFPDRYPIAFHGQQKHELFQYQPLLTEADAYSDFSNNITVEPLNKGHFGSVTFVLYLEAVLWWEVQITIVSPRVMSIGAIASVLYTEVVLWWEGPLQEAPLYLVSKTHISTEVQYSEENDSLCGDGSSQPLAVACCKTILL